MTANERPFVLGSHIGALLGYFIGIGNILVPLIIWLTKKDESALISEHAKASLNFQISMTLYTIAASIIGYILGISIIYFVLPLVSIICIILATLEANKGNLYNYPFSITFVK
jgi:uncharacterized Tic20 family protein